MSLLTNLVSYWSFESLLVDSTGTNNLTNNNVVTQGTGIIGNAANFAGPGDQSLQAANNASQSPTGSFTFDGWLNPTAVTNMTGWGVLHNESGTSGNPGYRIDIFNSTLRFLLFTITGTKTVTAAISANVWTYFRAWWDSGAGTIFLQLNNGTINSAASANGPETSSFPFFFGSLQGGSGNNYRGLIDEVGYWSRVLTTAEGTARYNGGAGNTYPFPAGPSMAAPPVALGVPIWGVPWTPYPAPSQLPVSTTPAPPVPGPVFLPVIQNAPPIMGVPWRWVLPPAIPATTRAAPPPVQMPSSFMPLGLGGLPPLLALPFAPFPTLLPFTQTNIPVPPPLPVGTSSYQPVQTPGVPIFGVPWNPPFGVVPPYGPSPIPPKPPTPPKVSNLPLLLRVPDVTTQAGVERLRRFTEILSSIINSLTGSGQLVQTGPSSWKIVP